MIYLENNSTDPYFNLALEEYLLHERPDLASVFLLWQNSPTVVVGRNQNTAEEINAEFIEKNGVKVVRRLSGGGAVYHDLGNVNFSLIVPDSFSDTKEGLDFRFFTEPVVRLLHAMNLPAEHSGRNDIILNERKFSGNAQVRHKGRILHHGTLLFDTNLDNVAAALNVASDKFTSKAVASVRSRVVNLAEFASHSLETAEKPVNASDLSANNKYLSWTANVDTKPDDYAACESRNNLFAPIPFPKTVAEFKKILLDHLLPFMNDFMFRCQNKLASCDSALAQRKLTDEETNRVLELRNQKYSSWDWNFGASPKYTTTNSHRFKWGKVEIRLDIQKGRIQDAQLIGDFFNLCPVECLTQTLIGLQHDKTTLYKQLEEKTLRDCLPFLSKHELIALLMGEDIA
ncbi:MAG: lipoate--protein ligase [Thermoguttaceae bacterium]